MPYMDPIGLFKPHVPHTVVYLQSFCLLIFCVQKPHDGAVS